MARRQSNPFRPGFNQAPVVFAGRVEVLDGAVEALEVAAYDARTPRPLILVGPRGVGKTVTLGEIATLAAEELSWPSVHVEAKAGGFLAELSLRLQKARQLLAGTVVAERPLGRTRVSGGKVEAKALGVGGAIEFQVDAADRAADLDVATALRQVMQVAAERGAGLLLTLDELQNASPDELNTLGALLQESVPLDWPLVVAVAALPSLRSNRGPRRLPTYLERAEWHELETLPAKDARQALVEPARQAGRPMTSEAADALLGIAGGYPYAIQVVGHFAWRASHDSAEITLVHAHAARPRIEADLEQLFTSRWEDASGREREYLRAAASAAQKHARPPTGGEVAAELGTTAKSVSYLRDRLLKKGTIYHDGAGRLHFITPGMGLWIGDLEH